MTNTGDLHRWMQYELERFDEHCVRLQKRSDRDLQELNSATVALDRELEFLRSAQEQLAAVFGGTPEPEVHTVVAGDGTVVSSRAVDGKTRLSREDALEYLRAELLPDEVMKVTAEGVRVEKTFVSKPLPAPGEPVYNLVTGQWVKRGKEAPVEEAPTEVKPPSWDPLGLSPHLWGQVPDLPEAKTSKRKSRSVLTDVGMSGRVYERSPSAVSNRAESFWQTAALSSVVMAGLMTLSLIFFPVLLVAWIILGFLGLSLLCLGVLSENMRRSQKRKRLENDPTMISIGIGAGGGQLFAKVSSLNLGPEFERSYQESHASSDEVARKWEV